MRNYYTLVIFIAFNICAYATNPLSCNAQIRNLIFTDGDLKIEFEYGAKLNDSIKIFINNKEIYFDVIDERRLLVDREFILFEDDILHVQVKDVSIPFCVSDKFINNPNVSIYDLENKWKKMVFRYTQDFDSISNSIDDIIYSVPIETSEGHDIINLNKTLNKTRPNANAALKKIAIQYINYDSTSSIDSINEYPNLVAGFNELKSLFYFLTQTYYKRRNSFSISRETVSNFNRTTESIDNFEYELKNKYNDLLYAYYWKDNYEKHPKFIKFFDYAKTIENKFSDSLIKINDLYKDVENNLTFIRHSVDEWELTLEHTEDYNNIKIDSVNNNLKTKADRLLSYSKSLLSSFKSNKEDYILETRNAFYNLDLLSESISKVDSLFEDYNNQFKLRDTNINDTHTSIASTLIKNKETYLKIKSKEKNTTILIIVLTILASLLLSVIAYIYWYRNKTKKNRLKGIKQIEI